MYPSSSEQTPGNYGDFGRGGDSSFAEDSDDAALYRTYKEAQKNGPSVNVSFANRMKKNNIYYFFRSFFFLFPITFRHFYYYFVFGFFLYMSRGFFFPLPFHFRFPSISLRASIRKEISFPITNARMN